MSTFGFLASIVMRLKLFWTPHLCICAAMCAGVKVWRMWPCTDRLTTNTVRRPWLPAAVAVALLAVASVQGAARTRIH
jgi:hypothetical protein